MSAILRALKKLDGAAPPRPSPAAVPKTRPPARVGRDFFIIISACLATGLTTATALHFYGPSGLLSQAPPPHVAAAAAPVAAPAGRPPGTDRATTGRPPKEPERPLREPDRTANPGARAKAAPAPELAAGLKNFRPAEAVTAAPPRPEPTTAPGPALNGPENAVAVLENSSLKLQALSWSEIPPKRLAVISNQVVREGAVVDGYTLVTINVDDVIVRKQGQSRRLIFGH